MARPPLRNLFVDLANTLESDPCTEILSASPEIFKEGVELFGARPDKEWSLTDCVSFVVMKRYNIVGALTTDHHFEQAGFERLLR